ncbi:uncharacterized protein LOC123313599 [Coccinella septempunctata]|uniref:uncharacterized protein LOC123313599 n=1 Tax=Coccinella septempunctata TaxID=41139 RepID=UPI001D062442|nr:uncharacterized protein LOC123313599 [Coccinella septempunctata]
MYSNMVMEDDKSPPRGLKYLPENEQKYSAKTLHGNWFENRLNYCFPKQKNDSLYNIDYVPKTVSHDSHEVWKIATAGQAGVDPIVHPKTGCYDYPNFFENFTSTSDLSYNHFPKLYNDDVQIKRHYRGCFDKYFPMEEYLEPFHNLTNFGLVDHKRELWCKTEANKRKATKSVYKDSFPPPHKDCYEFPRWGRPRALSSIISKTSGTLEALRLRGWNPGFFINTPSNPQFFNRPKSCNIFTWECPPEQKVCVPKHQWKNCSMQHKLVD